MTLAADDMQPAKLLDQFVIPRDRLTRFRVPPAQHDVNAAPRHVRRYRHHPRTARLSDDRSLGLMPLRVEDIQLALPVIIPRLHALFQHRMKALPVLSERLRIRLHIRHSRNAEQTVQIRLSKHIAFDIQRFGNIRQMHLVSLPSPFHVRRLRDQLPYRLPQVRKPRLPLLLVQIAGFPDLPQQYLHQRMGSQP